MLTELYANVILEAFSRPADLPAPVALYMGAILDGDLSSEVSAEDYRRQPVSFSDANFQGQVYSESAVVFTPLTHWGEVTHLVLFADYGVTDLVPVAVFKLTTPRDVRVGRILEFPAGSLVFSLRAAAASSQLDFSASASLT